MNDKQTDQAFTDADAEAAKRFEDTVRRMANTPPGPKPDKRSSRAVKTKKASKASS